jgi:ABC-2 type transport system permease protein
MSKRNFTDHALVQLTLMRMREFIREPEALFWSMIFPIALAAGLGIAFRNRPPEVLKIAAVTPHLAEALRQEKLLDVTQLSPELAEQFIRAGKVALVAEPGADGSVIYRYDDTNPEGRQARMLADQAIQRASGRQDPVAGNDQIMREPGSRYIDFLIPGLIGQNTMGGGLWGVGFLLVNFRIGKLLKRFTATPMPRRDFLLAILLARLTFLIPDVAVLLSLGVFAFGMPVQGSLWLVCALEIVGAMAFSGIGLLIASRAQSTETVSGLMNLVMLPMWIFSGVFFSSSRFPDAAQPFVRALPLTAVIDALRATMLRGAGWGQVLPELVVIGAWLVVGFLLAVRLFRWR